MALDLDQAVYCYCFMVRHVRDNFTEPKILAVEDLLSTPVPLGFKTAWEASARASA